MGYFMCRRSEVPELVTKAEAEARILLDELAVFYRGDIDIRIAPESHGACMSIGADLLVGGELVRHEDCCELLFLTLNDLILKRMLQSGVVSMGG